MTENNHTEELSRRLRETPPGLHIGSVQDMSNFSILENPQPLKPCPLFCAAFKLVMKHILEAKQLRALEWEDRDKRFDVLEGQVLPQNPKDPEQVKAALYIAKIIRENPEKYTEILAEETKNYYVPIFRPANTEE
jgi:hypothetical protein